MKSNKTEATRLMVMEWWHKVVCSPVRSVWFALSARLSARQNGGGLLKLHGDVQSCGYKDVQVMWEMLQRSESGLLAENPKRKHQPFCRVFIWSNFNHKASSISLPKSCFS